jgi:hypothetical protein
MQFKVGNLLKRKWSGAWQDQPKYLLVLDIVPPVDGAMQPHYKVLDIANNRDYTEGKYAIEGGYIEVRQ